MKTSVLRDEQNPVEESALILAKLSLIKRILLTCSSDEIRAWKRNTEKSEALVA